MKKPIKFIISSILMLSILMTISRCKSSEEPKSDQAGMKYEKDSTDEPEDSKDSTDSKDPQEAVVLTKKTKQKPLVLIVNNLASPTAPVIVGVYNSDNHFLYKEGRLKEYTFTPNGNTLTAEITDISYGEIAIAIYQDMNSNDNFDKNRLGFPIEGYAFSNNIKPKLRAPRYNECKFDYNSKENTVTTKLIK